MDGLSVSGSSAGTRRGSCSRRGFVAGPPPHPQRSRDVLEVNLADIRESNADLAAHLGMDDVRGENAASRRLAFEAGRDIDAVAEYVVALDDDVAEIDADAKLDGRLSGQIALTHRPLDRDGAFDRIDDAAELNQCPVAHHLDDAAMTRGDGGIECLVPDLPQRGERAGLVGLHHAGVTGDVGGEDGGKPTRDLLFRHADPTGYAEQPPAQQSHNTSARWEG